MSRRQAFDTGLSGSSAPRANGAGLPPRPIIGTPKASHHTSHVPIDRTDTAESADGKAGPDPPAAEEQPELEEASDVCFICAEPVTFWSVGVCGHRTCHICAVRLRSLYKKLECTYCKTLTPSLLFSRSSSAPFPIEQQLRPSPPERIAAAQSVPVEQLKRGERWHDRVTLPGTLNLSHFPYNDAKLGVVFEDEDMMEATLLLLRFNCPYTDCAHQASGWNELAKHTLSVHGLAICRICSAQLSRFAHEQALYPPHLLGHHDPSKVPRGQRPPKLRGKEVEMVASWDPPHPMCEFDHTAFFGPDELFKHMRASHYECEVCRHMGERDVYFQDYDRLEAHFQMDHYPCKVPSCVEQKFVVFGSEMDLRAHMISAHGEQMSSRDRAQVRHLPINFAETRDQHRGGPSRRGDHTAGAVGRGYTLASRESQQISTTVPMSQAQAQQQRRQVEVDRREATSNRRRAFETSLTNSQREQEDTARGAQALPEAAPSGFSTPREDVDEGVATQHAILLSRVSMMVGESPTKLTSFRSAVRQFKNNESSATDMIDTIFNVLDRDVDAAVGVVRELANLFGAENDGDKKKAVLEAINGFRVEQREQFPSLGNATPQGFGTGYAGIASGKILQAKRTTHTAGNSSASRTVWDRVEAAAASRPVARPPPSNAARVPGTAAYNAASFPSLGGGASKAGPSTTHSTPWASGGAGSGSKSPSVLAGPQIRSVNYPVATAPTGGGGKGKARLDQSAFPSLPTKEKDDRKALFAKPNTREESIGRITGRAAAPAPNGWGGVSNGVQQLSLDNDVEERAEPPSAGGGKKKGKGKQLLFTVSARP